jgi:LPXTG-motif cell wall-anchored protein
VFVYTKQWDWDQNIWIIPGDGSDDIKFTVQSTSSSTQTVNKTENDNKATANRTVIPAVPKTGPSGSLIWIILAALAIFGGYIYIRKKADI